MESNYRTAKVYSLAKILDYQAGEIIHDNIMANVHGGVTMLGFSQGMTLPQHAAPADVMVQVVEGKIEFTIDTEKIGLHTGDFMLLKNGMLHSVKALTDAKMLLTKIRP